jgi:DNA/RNA-binding domain of Phe-tRNA-synthetase-like protein
MKFIIQPRIFDFFPGIKVVAVVAQGVNNHEERAEVNSRWEATWAAAQQAAVYGNAQSHPRVRPWRERFRALGIPVKQYPSSIEAILRRALKGGGPFRINPLVDFYNAVSLSHMVPAGGIDLAALQGPLELRLTRQGDWFLALDASEPEEVPSGEVAYADGSTILTRHFVWRQARTGLIGRETRDIILISEVLGDLEDGVAEAVLRDFQDGLKDYFGVDSRAFLLDVTHREISW